MANAAWKSTTGQTPTVGHIGLGRIGLPIALHVRRAGYEAIGFRRTAEAMAPFLEAGGVAARSASDVASRADVVLQCLPSTEAFEAVLEEILPAVWPGQVVVELGTVPLATKERWAQRVAERGATLLDGEVSGSPPMVEAKSGVVFLGGDGAAVERVWPVVTAFAPVSFHLGAFGAATKMKLVANHLVAVHTFAAAEALALATKAGLDPAQVVKVIGPGAGGSRMFDVRAPLMAERRFEPALGPFTMLEKYLHLGRALAEEVGAATPLLDVAAAHYLAAIEAGRGDQDIAAIVEIVESLPRLPG